LQKPGLLDIAVQVLRREGEQYFCSFHNSWKLLVEVAQDPRAGETICGIDALDECEGYEYILLHERTTRCTTKFLVTSRPYFVIEQSLDHRTIRLAGEDESESIKQEIDLVIKHSVGRIAFSLKLDSMTQELLQRRLLSIMNRTYLWLHLTLNHIKQSLGVNTPKKMEKFIDEMPQTVYDAYETILKRSPRAEEARKLLHIVIAAVRPLTLIEMNMALNIDDKGRQRSREEVDLDPLDTFPIYIKNICGLFVNIVDSKVYLLHQTAKEFLVSRGDTIQSGERVLPYTTTWRHSIETSESNLVLAKVCLNYLSFAVFEDKPLPVEAIHFRKWEPERRKFESTLPEYTKEHEFLEYASNHWALHFRLAKQDRENFDWWFRVCDIHSRRFLTWFGVYWNSNGVKDAYDRIIAIPTDFTSFMLASCFGNLALAKQLLNESNLDATDSLGLTYLFWATRNGNQSVVQLLLDRGAQPNVKDHRGFTPLAMSSFSGNSEMVRLLIDKGAAIDCKNDSGQTPLSHAARQRQQHVVKLLLERGAQPELQDNSGWSPLAWTASKGHIEIVKLLVEGGANPHSENIYGRTPLANAVRDGHDEMVAYLLQYGAQPKFGDSDGILLSVAVQGGHLETMKLLIERGGFDPNGTNGNGLPPLECALGGRRGDQHEEVKLLLQQGAQSDLTCPSGAPPLVRAARRGQERNVQLLIGHGADPNIMDWQCRTQLECARRVHKYCKQEYCGHAAVIALLEPITSVSDPSSASDDDRRGSETGGLEGDSADSEEEATLGFWEDYDQEGERHGTLGDYLLSDREPSSEYSEDDDQVGDERGSTVGDLLLSE